MSNFRLISDNLEMYKVDAELGRASDSGWSDGKIVSKATWKQLASRFGGLERPEGWSYNEVDEIASFACVS